MAARPQRRLMDFFVRCSDVFEAQSEGANGRPSKKTWHEAT